MSGSLSSDRFIGGHSLCPLPYPALDSRLAINLPGEFNDHFQKDKFHFVAPHRFFCQ
jgi:hypothetical protein